MELVLGALMMTPLPTVSELGAYTDLHRAAFGSNKMSADWRQRTLRGVPGQCPGGRRGRGDSHAAANAQLAHQVDSQKWDRISIRH